MWSKQWRKKSFSGKDLAPIRSHGSAEAPPDRRTRELSVDKLTTRTKKRRPEKIEKLIEKLDIHVYFRNNDRLLNPEDDN